MKEMFDLIIDSDVMTYEEKSLMIERLFNASHGINIFVTKDLFFKFFFNSQKGESDLQLWYRNIRNDGLCTYGNTEYSKDQILDLLHRQYIDLNRQK